MKIESYNHPITEDDIKVFERENNIILPNDYKKFLIEYNGGEPLSSLFKLNRELGTIVINNLYGLNTKEKYDDIIKAMQTYSNRISNQFIPIGDDPGGDQIVLGISGDFKGKVYFWDHNTELENDVFTENELPENMYFLADSFDEFIDKLEEDTEV
jgi:cell wall assembly regulator SMI1